MSILNRNCVYIIRKNLPNLPILQKKLASIQISKLEKQLLPEEDVRKGEQDTAGMLSVLSKCRKTRSEQMNRLEKEYQEYLKKADITYSESVFNSRKNQMLFDCMAYGFSPDEVTYYGLYEKTSREKREYVTDLDRKIMQYRLSRFKDLQYVFDKTVTYRKFKEYYKREAICVASKKDFKVFREFAGKHAKFIVKAVSASCGYGVTIMESDPDHPREQFEEIMHRGRCSLEELIAQSAEIAVFNASSVNTLRIITFNTDSDVVIGPSFFRTGRAGSFIDNARQGGILAGVDIENGQLNSDGYDEYLHIYSRHPDSGVQYYGFQLPEWENCVKIVKEMARMIPGVGYIGWDMAYSSKGWVIVEANGGGKMVSQLAYGKGCKKEVEAIIAGRRLYG